MSDILKHLTRNENIFFCLFCMCFLIIHFILKFFPQILQSQFYLCDNSCGKDIYFNVLGNVWKIFKENWESWNNLENSTNILLVPSWRYKNIWHLWQKTNISFNGLFSLVQHLRSIYITTVNIFAYWVECSRDRNNSIDSDDRSDSRGSGAINMFWLFCF